MRTLSSERKPAWSRTFGHAFRGLGILLRDERNARVHAVAAIGSILAGLVLGIDRYEWLALTLTIVLVVSLEAVNTALEALGDRVSPEFDASIGRAKDLAAGAVLISAIGAVGIGILIFGPRILQLLS